MTSVSVRRISSRAGLVVLAYIAFISLGLPDGLLGVAYPSIRQTFGLPLDALGLMLIFGTSGYLTSSFFSGKIMARLGVGGLLAASCALTGAALLGYTLVPQWWMFLLLGTFAGLGAGAIDAGINTYIAAHYGEGLMQWLHASYGIGVTLGPMIMTGALNLFGDWRLGYRVVSVAQLALALTFALTMSAWKQNDRPAGDTGEARKLTEYKTPLTETLRQPRTWLSLLMFFIYTGVEVCLGLWAYTILTEGRGVASEIAGLVAGSYWATFTVGRIIAGLYARRVSINVILRFSLLGALLGALLFWWNPGQTVSLIGVALVGFAVAPIFPALMSGTSARVGAKHAANTIGMQISAAGFGGMTLPGLAGVLARSFSLEAIPLYLVILVGVLFALFSVSLSGMHAAPAPAD